MFTIGADLRVEVNRTLAEGSPWCVECVLPYDEQSIQIGAVPPSSAALRYHWDRFDLTPDK